MYINDNKLYIFMYNALRIIAILSHNWYTFFLSDSCQTGLHGMLFAETGLECG